MGRKLLIVLLLVASPVNVQCQSNIVVQDPANANAQNLVFYFDSNSDCNGPIKEMYGFEATIRGNQLSSTRLGPKTCMLRLKSTGQFDGTVLDIEVRAMNVLDCSTRITIYDGDGAQTTLMAYDCYSNNAINKRRFQSTGDTVTFIMTRENINSYNFDIEIKVNAIRGGTQPGYENNFGSGYFFDKFQQPIIVALIGGFYAIILVVCNIIILVFACRYRRLNKLWESKQLDTMRPSAPLDTKSKTASAWSVEMKQSRGPNSQKSLAMTDPYSDTNLDRSEDNLYRNVDAMQTKQLVNVKKDSSSNPRYATNNTSFMDPEDEADQFVEKVLKPRVKAGYSKNRQPPPYEEAISDNVTDHSSDEDSVPSGSTNSIRKRPVSSDEDKSSRTESRSSYTQSKSETDSESEDDRSSRGHRSKNHKHRGKTKKNRRRRKESDEYSQASKPQKQSRSRVPQTSQQAPPQPHMQQVPYGAYPPGQFIPVMVGPNQFHQGPMVAGFPPQPPSYSEQQLPSAETGVHPRNPPVYSYLVRRGYKPMDPHNSASTASQFSGAGKLEEPDLRLDSGVEYMRR